MADPDNNLFVYVHQPTLQSSQPNIISRWRPSWDEYFLTMAFLASSRSHDAERQHGCILVDDHNRVLSTGYNGFPRGLLDHCLPNIRPGKYRLIIHAEKNSILNSKTRPENATAYITGRPCLECLKALYQSGITNLVCFGDEDDMPSAQFASNPEEQQVWYQLVEQCNIKIKYVKFDLKEMVCKIFNL